MKRFMIAVTVWGMGLAWVVGGGTPVSASAQVPAAVASSPVSASGPLAAASPPGGLFTPLPTTRVFDGTATTTPRPVRIGGVGGVPYDATAVVVNTEVFAPTAAGYVRVTPAGQDASVAVQVFAAGQAISNLVVVKLSGGWVQVKVSAGSARILMDVSGYYRAGAGASYSPLPTARVFDGTATTTPRPVTIAGVGGVPLDATAVVVNTEVFAPTAAGYVRVTPAGQDASVAVQEFAAGQAISNLVVVKLVGGTIQVKVSAGSARILMDVSGYYRAGVGASFTPLPTARVFDGTATTTPRQVTITGLGGVPTDATAVVVNTEVFNPTAAGYVRVTPAGQDPNVAVQEFARGQTISNLVAVKLVGGKIQVKVSAGSARILMDVSGYFAGPVQTWSPPTSVAPGGRTTALSCPTPTSCTAVDSSGNATAYNGSTWATPRIIDAHHDLVGLSCPTTGFCMAIDASGYALSDVAGAWSAPVAVSVAPSTAGLSDVSCASSTFCMATNGTFGTVYRFNGTSWSGATKVSVVST